MRRLFHSAQYDFRNEHVGTPADTVLVLVLLVQLPQLEDGGSRGYSEREAEGSSQGRGVGGYLTTAFDGVVCMFVRSKNVLTMRPRSVYIKWER